MLKINLSKQAIKFLELLASKQAKQIERKLTEISVTPIAQDTKQLKGYQDFLRVDSGEYRIIYKIDKNANTLIVLTIGKRNDGEIYKKFKRMLLV